MVLFIWGTYVESAAIMIDSLVLMNKYDDDDDDNIGAVNKQAAAIRHGILQEFQQQKKKTTVTQQDYDFWDKNAVYTGRGLYARRFDWQLQ